MGATLKAVPLHIVAVLFVTTGLGLIVTETVNVDPAHIPASPLLGVTV